MVEIIYGLYFLQTLPHFGIVKLKSAYNSLIIGPRGLGW